jgi:hypothetical protein
VFTYIRSGKKCCGRQKINVSVGNWAVELRQELHNIGLTYVWRNQRERDFTEITKTLKDWCNDSERQDILAANITSSSELLLGWNSVVARSVKVEINYKETQMKKMSFVLG